MAKNKQTSVSKFENTLSEFTTTVDQNENELIKSGIIFYESDKGSAHKDSKGKTHYITKQLIEEIVNNTNKLLDEVDIPIVKEHNKVIDEQVGLIADKLEARIVTSEDVLNRPKLQKLIGKTAIFCNSAKILDKVLIDKAKSGIPLRVSIGLDVPNKIIRELSVVTIPALNMATLFSKQESPSNFGYLTLAEQIAQRQNAELDKEAAKELFDDLLEVIENIKNADDTILQGNDPNELIVNAMDEFEDQLALLLGIGEMPEENMQSQYNDDIVLDAFSMSEMENLILDDFMFGGRKKKSLLGEIKSLKNLGYSKKKGVTYKNRAVAYGKGSKALRKATMRNIKGSFARSNNNAEFFGNINLNLGKKKKEPGLLTKTARAVGTGVALAAGARYGGAALLKRSATARNLAQKGLAKVAVGSGTLAGKTKNNIVRNIATSVNRKSSNAFMNIGKNTGARGTLQSDVNKVKSGFNALRNRFKKKTTV